MRLTGCTRNRVSPTLTYAATYAASTGCAALQPGYVEISRGLGHLQHFNLPLSTATKQSKMIYCRKGFGSLILSGRSRTRRRWACCPPRLLLAEHKIKSSALRKHIFPSDPRLLPLLAIDLQALHIRRRIPVATFRGHDQLLPASELEAHILEEWTADEEGRLASHWISERVEISITEPTWLGVAKRRTYNPIIFHKIQVCIAPASEFPGIPPVPAL